MKMRKNFIMLLLAIFTLFYASCAKPQTLGTGVSIDKQGKLVIDAPLYVIDETGEKPELKPAPSSMNNEVYVYFPWGDGGNDIEFTGGIVKGRLALTIKKPDENWMNDVASFWSVPDDLFTSGSDVRIGELNLRAKGQAGYGNPSIHLVNRYDLQPIRGTAVGRELYYFYGNYYEYIYSMGDVNISGKFNLPQWYNWIWHVEFDIHLKQGWNVIRTEDNTKEKIKNKVDTFDKFDIFTSSLPSKDAVWVLFE